MICPGSSSFDVSFNLRITGEPATMWSYGSYRLSSFDDQAVELRNEVSDFWIDNQAFANATEAKRRVSEVVLAMRNSRGELVGVTTVYEKTSQSGLACYYRMFIRPEDRVFKLAHFALLKTRDVLPKPTPKVSRKHSLLWRRIRS